MLRRTSPLLACLFAAATTVALAQDVTITLPSERISQTADNRRNLGEMSPIALGDIDGDGRADLLMGAPRAGGFTTVDSGMVYARFGADYLSLPAASDDGGVYYDLTARPDLVVNPLNSSVESGDSFGRLPSGLQIFPERGGEYFGAAIASGDFDGDNFADIAIAATNPLGEPKLGTVYLVLGRADLDGILTIEGEIFAGNAVEIKGRELGARFGEVLHFADLDNDGFDDLIIGTPRAGIGGVVDIVYGRPAFGFSRTSIDALPPPVTRIFTTVAEERLGSAFADADINGDGFPELFIGAPRWPIAAQSRGRTVAVSLAGTQPVNVNLSLTPPYMQVLGVEDFLGAGSSLATGDLDQDGLVDLMIGAPYARFGVASNVGKVYQISDPDRFAGTSAGLPNDASIQIRGTVDQEFFGTSIACGPYDLAAGDDLIVGSPGDLSGGTSRTGSVWIYRGGTLPFTLIPKNDPGRQITRMQVPIANYRLGTQVVLGEFDGQFESDIFCSGDGRTTIPANCASNLLTDWQTCHDNRNGIRVWGIPARSVIQPPIALEANPAWMMLE